MCWIDELVDQVLSAKSKIDIPVLRKQLEAAGKVIQAQDARITALKRRVATAARSKKSRVLRPVLPSFALQIEYRRKLECLIDEMNASVKYWLSAAFKANEPELTALAQDGMAASEVEATRSMQWRTLSAPYPIGGEPDKAGIRRAANSEGMSGSIPERASTSTLAVDALPARELRWAVRRLARRWLRRFNEASEELATWFSLRAHRRSTRQLETILKKGGWSVEMRMTPAQRDILAATIQENVSLIRSIPSQYFTQIEGMVARSVTTGRDLQQLTNDLQRQFRVTRRRAELIARDQNNKATASITRARQIELGITEAIWVHSGAGKHPRPTHVRNNGKKYDTRTGWWDPAERKYVFPGELINCRCVSRSVVSGFS